ncbi:glutamyl-tRNA(Gln) amidotransferase subunit A, mitochondrial [Patella vulgata]|uniref:glutamyl-tRNA(Gln) amidotransferase subunit A, mitochondrial n=1 Tax=Patella vulgata TaxID=6465 RepID=UPI00217F9C65|nr:glutamyl-tRNA(Gln) amidotransferase subunit A, mitochondrial [Patella vulgata]
MLSLQIREVLKHLKEGKITASELCNLSIKRAKRLKDLNIYISETPEYSQQLAEISTNRTKQGEEQRLLEGIPVAFKDNFCTTAVKTTCGSRMLANFQPPYNATMVEKILQHGGVLMGKANMDEFAMGAGSVDSAAGPVRNPWRYKFKKSNKKSNQSERSESHVTDNNYNDWFITGGSSGGSAAAIATGACFGAFGSDTGGSTRIPAAFCGVAGLKPTYGRLSRHGLIPLVNSMDVPGIMGKTTDDVAVILNGVSGFDMKDSTTLPGPHKPINLPDRPDVKHLHIGIPQEYLAPGTTKDVTETWQQVADMLDDAGAKVTSVSLPHTQYSILVYSVLCCCEVASNMARYDGIEFGYRDNNDVSTEEMFAGTRHHGFNDVVRSRIMAGNYYLLKENYERYFIKAQKVRRLISDDFNRVFSSGVDLLLTPTTIGPAVTYEDFTKADNQSRSIEFDVYTQPSNLVGIPALTVPAGLSRDCLPIGLQILGPHLHEQSILSLGKWIEQQVNFPYLNLDFLDNEQLL